MKSKVVHIVLNTFVQDSRVMRECKSLAENGYDVTVIAYWMEDLKEDEFQDGYTIKRLRLKTKSWTNNSIVQVFKYLEFLFKSLLTINKIKPKVCHGHDPSGLFVAYFAKVILNCHIIYDSHELWGHTSHMNNYNKILYKIGGYFEKLIINKTDFVITVNNSIGDLLKKHTGKESIKIIRNIPENNSAKINLNRNHLKLPNSKFILIYIGSLAKGRGVDQLIKCMNHVRQDIGLAIVGGEPKYHDEYNRLIEGYSLMGRVGILPAVSPNEVISICSVADVGIHPIENTCLNHFYCLPNKLFQYIQAGIPVLCSDFPEMRKIVNGYKVGEVFDVEDINNISNTINIFFEDMEKLMEYKNNCIKASATLNWNIEKIKLLDIYSQLLSTSN